MTVTKIGERSDGTLLGEDENGKMYVGIKRRAGWDEVVRHVTDNGTGTHTIRYMVGDYLISKGEMQTITEEIMAAYLAECAAGDNPSFPQGFSPTHHGYVAEKKFISVPMADGTNQEFERLIDVLEWQEI